MFSRIKLRGLVPNPYIHVSVSDLYIPMICLPIWLQQNRQTNPDTGMWNLETEHYNSVLEITRPHSFLFWEYINWNQTFILDSHQPFICSAPSPPQFAQPEPVAYVVTKYL
jgi:hypothetical protein